MVEDKDWHHVLDQFDPITREYAINVFPRPALIRFCGLVRDNKITTQEVLWTLSWAMTDPTAVHNK